MSTPTFSIIVPVYNAQKVISDCIKSILNQSYADFEAILVDDGSKDDSYEICKSFEKDDNRIKVYHKENTGVSSTRNYGLSKAIGKWFVCIDSDDTVSADWLENYYGALDADMIIQGCKVVGEKNTLLNSIYDSFSENEDRYKPLTDALQLINPVWSKCMRADIIRENNIRFDTSCQLSEDLIFVLDFLRNSKSLRTICKTGYNYRVYNSHLTKIVYEPEYMIHIKSSVLRSLNRFCPKKSIFNRAITQNEIHYVAYYAFINYDSFGKKQHFALYNFMREFYSSCDFLKMHNYCKIFILLPLNNSLFDLIFKVYRKTLLELSNLKGRIKGIRK